ncbi:hypothetical protein IQ07DRAFT_116303 [Pyrenochaeta sp. DS3sAY3a]|nr:hypothetical protein IQ07DRAFT_116303 [Pyrenochaeta sp. DS3sAY3a]
MVLKGFWARDVDPTWIPHKGGTLSICAQILAWLDLFASPVLCNQSVGVNWRILASTGFTALPCSLYLLAEGRQKDSIITIISELSFTPCKVHTAAALICAPYRAWPLLYLGQFCRRE